MKILNSRVQKDIASSHYAKSFKISEKRYYQIHGEMLEACYDDLVPEDGVRLLIVLGNKQLFRHFLHEIKRQEARIAGNAKKQEEFYFKVLKMRQMFVLNEKFHHELIKELDAYATRYAEVKAPDPDDKYFLRIVEMNAESSKNKNKQFSIEKQRAMLDEYESIFQHIKNGKNLLAQFITSDRLMLAYSYGFFGRSPEPYARYGLELLNKHPHEFSGVKDFYEIECSQFLPTAEQPSPEKIKDFLMHSSARYGPSIFYIGRFLRKIIERGDEAWVAKFIEKFFPYSIDLLQHDSAVSWAFLYVQYYVYTGDYANAETYLAKAFHFNSGRNKSLSNENYFRCYDGFLIAMRGNAKEAEKRTAKHLRYIHEHGYRDMKNIYYFLKLTHDLIKAAGKDPKKANTIHEKFIATKEVEAFRFLFEKMYEQYFLNEK